MSGSGGGSGDTRGIKEVKVYFVEGRKISKQQSVRCWSVQRRKTRHRNGSRKCWQGWVLEGVWFAISKWGQGGSG